MALDLAYRTFGAGPPLLVLHGLFGSARNWATIAQQLGQSRTAHALDLRNHGESPWSQAMDYPAMADDVAAFMDREGLASAQVIGHSMGGKTAMTLALTHGARITDLVVVDIAPVTYDQRHLAYIQAMAALDLSGLRRRAEADGRLQPQVPDPAVRSFLLHNLVPGRDGFAWRLNLAALETAMGALTSFPSALAGRAFAGRTLFVAGAKSDYLQPSHEPAVRRHFPNAAFATIPGAGHWVHAEAPGPFLSAVETFLGDTP